MDENKMLMVRADALPEVFTKVVEAKKLLAANRTMSIGEAAGAVGLSRSAFYKYRNRVFSYGELMQTDIDTMALVIKDESGALSKVIAAVAEYGANILTINQSVPTNGMANVTVSFAHGPMFSRQEFAKAVENLDVVLSASIQ